VGNEELLGDVQALLAASQDAKSYLDAPVGIPQHSETFLPKMIMPNPVSMESAVSRTSGEPLIYENTRV